MHAGSGGAAADRLETLQLLGKREGETVQVATGPGQYAVDRTYNPAPGVAEQAHVSGRQVGGETDGGGGYYSRERCWHAVLFCDVLC